MGKKIAIAVFVILAGLMLGFIISDSLKNRNKSTNNPPSSQQNSSATQINPTSSEITKDGLDLQVSLIANPPDLKHNENLATNLQNASKSILQISYSNTGSQILTGLQLQILNARSSTQKTPQYKLTSSKTAAYNKELSANKTPVFNIPDAAPDKRTSVTVFLFPKEVGQIQIRAVIKNEKGILGSSPIVNLNVN